MTLFEDLKWRGLIETTTSSDLETKLNAGGLTFYIGVDPTADSLHIGHYASLLTVKRLADAGHHPIILVGGATGLIGDPKPNSERPMITKEELDQNYLALSKQIKGLFGFDMVNNYDWAKEINFVDYLRDYGKHFSINYMLNKETVKSRLEVGITYTEFSYMIMQAIDFLYLFEHNDCTLQIGGQDQWGNITAGVELIRRKTGSEVYGLTMPLITKADGKKFGKTETGTLWLDKEKTSSYELYQYFLNTEDEKVIEYLKRLTFLTKDEIDATELSLKNQPEDRLAQKILAREIVTLIHGADELNEAIRITEVLFGGSIKELTIEELLIAFKDMPIFEVKEGIQVVDLLVDNNICLSKREARELITTGAITINDLKVADENYVIYKEAAIDEQLLVIRRGKKKYYLAKIA